MNIEEAIEQINKMLKIEKDCLHYDVCKQDIEAIETLLTAYEKEKEKNKSIIYNYEMVVDKLENSTPNDKIKAKIEEYRKLLYSYEKDLKEKLHYVDKESMNCIIAQIQVLQSLLEKEKIYGLQFKI